MYKRKQRVRRDKHRHIQLQWRMFGIDPGKPLVARRELHQQRQFMRSDQYRHLEL